MSYLSFRDPRTACPLPIHFPSDVTRHQRFWGRRIECLPTWFLSLALEHPDLMPKYLGGLRAAIRYELARRGRA